MLNPDGSRNTKHVSLQPWDFTRLRLCSAPLGKQSFLLRAFCLDRKQGSWSNTDSRRPRPNRAGIGLQVPQKKLWTELGGVNVTFNAQMRWLAALLRVSFVQFVQRFPQICSHALRYCQSQMYASITNTVKLWQILTACLLQIYCPARMTS